MSMKKKIMFVFGTRPEAIKMASVIAVMGNDGAGLEPIVVVTAQHRQMLDQVLKLFNIKVDHDLNIMEEKQTLPKILTKSLTGLEKIIDKEKVAEFRDSYKNPDEFCCLFVIDGQFTKFVFIPYPED